MRPLLLAPLLLAACSTNEPTLHSVPHTGADHYAPTPEQVAASTSNALEDAKLAELAYQGASLAVLPLLKSKAAPSNAYAIEDRAFNALQVLRTTKAGTAEHLAAKAYFNFSLSELLLLLGADNAEPTHAH